MAESLTTSLVFHITTLGLSQNYSNYSHISRFTGIFRSDIKSNSRRAKLKILPSVEDLSSRRLRLCKFIPEVSTVEYGSVTEREHPQWDDERKEVLDDVNDRSVVPEDRLQYLEERDEKNLSWRLLKLSRKDKVRSALELYSSMDFIGLRPDSHACNALLSCLLRNERLDDAFMIFESMNSSGRISGHSYNLILQGVAKTKGFQAGFELFEELASNEDHKNKFDQVVFSLMLTLCHEEKDWLKSERIWRKMNDIGHVGSSVTYRLLVLTFLDFCQHELVIAAYHEMLQNGVEPDTRTIEAVILAFVQDQRWDSALHLFRGMMKRKEQPHHTIFNALIRSLGINGQVHLAFKVYDCMKSLGHVPTAHTWNALLLGLCRAKQYGDALRLFEKVQQETPSAVDLHLYNTALAACQKLGLWRRALQIIWEMEDSGLSIPILSYNRVIEACTFGNEPEVALQVYHHMVHRNQTPDTFTLLSLLKCCIWASFWEEVREILDLVPPNAQLYNAAVQGLCKRRQNKGATKLYKEMRELGLPSDNKTRAMMLRYLPKSKL